MKRILLLTTVIATTLAGCRDAAVEKPLEVTPTTAIRPSPTQRLDMDIGWRVNLDGSETIEIAANRSFEAWLRSFREPGTSPAYRLLEHRIASIEAVPDLDLLTNYDQVFKVSFSVLPGFAPSSWIAGDGRFGPDGWIIDKVEHLGVLIEGDSLSLHRLGPCPEC